MSTSSAAEKTGMQKFLDVVERVGNKVPHPAVIFLMLLGLVVVLSHVLHLAGTTVTYEVIVPGAAQPSEAKAMDAMHYGTASAVGYDGIDETSGTIETRTATPRSLLSTEGVRFMYTSLIPNFMAFTAVGLIIVAMLGVGVAEESGLIKALIRKLVVVAPPKLLVYIMVFVGIVSSIAADAGYLVLIPLAGAAFLSVGRHPLAGLAAGFAAVAGAFTVNMLIKPLDAVLVEFTNDAIHLVDPDISIGLASNLWFSAASVLFLTLLIAFITERVIEPRLGKFEVKDVEKGSASLTPEEQRGLRFAGFGLLGVLAFFGLLSLPANAPLRDAATGTLIGNTPFMNGLIAFIASTFFVAGFSYGIGAGTMKKGVDAIKAMEKSVSTLGSLIFLLFIIAQFIAFFNYSNMATILAVSLSNALTGASIGPLPLLLGFIVVVILLDFLITGAIAKWAIFAPIFVPLLMRLGVEPESVLAAYRVADSPINMITPLNAYFALVVTFCQKYDKNAGVGTVVALMLPYVAVLMVLWTLLFVVWQVLGLPWGI
ncbi:MAG TPA: AbgT family transporter [Kiritimatiellia bacterium]|nr:AbgT family transporter [Kiritimatiellia bacterium]HMP34115.1 AbgT family transporter [Kiritimatiellia bacterium]